MGVSRLVASSRCQALELCITAVKSAIGKHGAVDVVVAAPEDGDCIKLALCKEAVLGVSVQTLPHWIEGQWELWGDGSRLVSEAQRHILLRPVLAGLTGFQPSAEYVGQFASFARNALACDAALAQRSLSDALQQYLQLLENAGVKDPAYVIGCLKDNCATRALVAFCLDTGQPYVRECLDAVGRNGDVTLVSRCLACESEDGQASENGELEALRHSLFTGREGLQSSGAFTAMEVHGTHAEPEALVQLVCRAMESGCKPSQIIVAFPQLADACSTIAHALAKSGIPVSCFYTLPFGKTAFGSAFLHLEAMLREEDESWCDSAAFMASPYSGVRDEDARAFAMVWRSRNGSTRDQRRQDLDKGFRRSVPSTLWKEKLADIKLLMEAPGMEDRVRLMFENGRKAAYDPDRMADDASAANALLAYLDNCQQLGQVPNLKGIEQLQVSLTCVYGEEEQAVRICDVDQVPFLENVSHVIFARLGKDDYPMAQKPASFDRYLEEAGHAVSCDTALRNRLRLLDALECAEGFSCYRLTSDKEGSECCQSALWDELMTSYRGPDDEDKPVHALPKALVDSGCGLRIAEEDLFFGSRQPVVESLEVNRGEVDESALDLLFPDADSFSESFSPTAIEDYYRCPYRWLICRRIGANSIDKSFDQIAKGNLAHGVLERLYVTMHAAGIPRVTPENLDQCLAMADEAFEWQRQHDVDKHNLVLNTSREWEESEFVRRQVREFVRRDARFLPGFTPTYFELKLETPEGGPLAYAGVPVRGKVDRIDVDDQGRAIVMDYKLSSLSSGYGLSKDGGMPTRIQTDIYALLVQRCLQLRGVDVKVVGSVYRSYAKNNLRGVYAQGIDWGPLENVRLDLDALPGGACLTSYDEYLSNVEENVEKLLIRMRDGDVFPNPLCDDACEHCLAQGFCHERRR